MTLRQIDIRDAFFDRLLALGARDERIIVMTNDMDVFSLRRFKQEHPNRFINIGVAEQNMINVASGLASCGKMVVVYGISSFVTFRCYEQIKFNVCSMKLPLVLVGVGSGFTFSFDGPTHHGTQDIAVMRALPEMSIFNPGDTVSASNCADQVVRARSPAYVRIDKGPFPALYEGSQPLDHGYGVLRPLADVNIVSTGYMTPRMLAVADALVERGTPVGVVDLFRLKPLSDRFATDVLGQSRCIVTVEENAVTGGLGTILSEVIADGGWAIRLLRLAAPDEQLLRYGERDWVLAGYGLDNESILDRVAQFATSR